MFVAGRYRIIDIVGSGGTSQVYRAEDRLTREVVALKRLRLNNKRRMLNGGEQRDDDLSLALEFRALAGLRHPYIVPVLDYGFDDDRQPFLAMQLIDGAQTLTEAARSLGPTVQIELVVQVLSALMYLHRRDIIHRDIKPANVLVGSDGVARVLDFGLAVNGSVSIAADRGGLAGTIAYMAPELFSSPVATVQSDLYSLGVMAYEMLTGEYPFAAGSAPLLMYSILHSEPDLSRLRTPVRDVVARLITRDLNVRYASAQDAIRDICAATGVPEPLESRSVQDSFLHASQFVGREAELARLTGALDRILPAPEGQPARLKPTAWLIGGESGVGKSRLIDELRIHALMRGVRVLQGQALGEGGQTYQLWRQPLRHLALSTEFSPEEVAVLKELVPDIEAIVGCEAPALAPLDGRDHLRRLVNTIGGTVRRQTCPTLLILEDLQWAVESLEPLKLLLNSLDGLPLVIVGTYRREEAPDLPDLLPGMTPLLLDRLDEAEVVQLSTSILGEAGAQPELLRLLSRQTDGNAFFIVEVLRALADASGGLGGVGRSALPDSIFAGGVVEFVERRLARLPDWALPLLEVAAAGGRHIDLTVLHAVRERVPEWVRASEFRLDQWLTVCANLAVIEAADGVWRLSHETLRDVILNRLDGEHRARLHRLLATTLEDVYPGDMSRAEALLEHWYQAGELEKELPYLTRVVELQIDNPTGLEVARLLLERTLARLDEDDPRRAMLLVYLSQTWLRIDYSHGEAIARQALDVARQHHDTRATAQALYVLAAHVREQSRYGEAEGYQRESLALFDALEDPHGSANNLVNLGIIYHDRGDYDAAQDHYEQALTIYRLMGNEGKVAFLEVLLGTLTRERLLYDEAIARIEHGLGLAYRIGHFSVISQALNNLGVIATERGEFERARTYLTESLSVNTNIGNQWGVANCHINLGFSALMLDDDVAARAHLVEGITRAEAISAINLALEGIVGFGWLLERQGALETAAQLVGLTEPLANIDVQRRIRPLVARLKPRMSDAAYLGAVEAGATMDVTAVANALLGR